MRTQGVWPAILFSLALVISVGLGLITSNSGWCEGSETGVVCARNWVDATGSFLTMIVAVVAAAFAYRQYQAAQRQNLLSRIPTIERILSALHDIRTEIGQAGMQLAWVNAALGEIKDNMSNVEANYKGIQVYCHHAAEGIRRLEERLSNADSHRRRIIDDKRGMQIFTEYDDATLDIFFSLGLDRSTLTDFSQEYQPEDEDFLIWSLRTFRDEGKLQAMIDRYATASKGIASVVKRLDQVTRELRDERDHAFNIYEQSEEL